MLDEGDEKEGIIDIVNKKSIGEAVIKLQNIAKKQLAPEKETALLITLKLITVDFKMRDQQISIDERINELDKSISQGKQ